MNHKYSLLSLSVILASPLQAATIINSEAASFTVSTDDLLQTSLSSVSASPLDNRGTSVTDNAYLQGLTPSGEASLRDGVWFDNPSNSRGSAVVENDEFAIYNLDLTTNPLGYNIDQIDLYSNWGSGQGRDEIRVTIAFSLVTTPTLFDQVLVTNEAYNPPNETQGKMSITDIDATGIAGVRFDWPSGQENNAVGYSELDVIGSATPVPEPSSTLLIGLASLALLRRRK